jgi:hypothetical protein
LAAAGERPAARHESGWTLTPEISGGLLVNYRAAGAGEAALKRHALVRWMAILGAEGWTVEGRGARKLAWLRVSAATIAEREAAAATGEENNHGE